MRRNLPGQFDLPVVIGPVHFGDQRLQDRRTGRHFGHFHPNPVLCRNRLQQFPDAARDRMALVRAISLWSQVDLDVRHILSAAHVVMADKPVEVERRGRSHVRLEIRDFRNLVQLERQARAWPPPSASRLVPSGISTITWNSLLLSNGSIFTMTSLK